MTGGRKSDWMVWLLALPVVWWAAVLIADSACGVGNFMEILEAVTEKLNHPFDLHANQYTLKSVLVCTVCMA